jgi:hypothetical protein
MEQLNKQIENTASLIKVFKTEQERLLLRANDDQHFKTRSKISTVAEGAVKLLDAGGNNRDNDIVKILNTECVLMPFSRDSKSYQKLWPQALVVNRSKNIAEMGQIESHGSLWKIVLCDDNNELAATAHNDVTESESRVMLQTSVRIVSSGLVHNCKVFY